MTRAVKKVILDIDDGFTELLGYTEDDFEAGIVFKQFVPSVEYEEVITELREKFIDKRYVSYVQEFVSKDGKPLKVVAFYKIENKLLAGHSSVLMRALIRIDNYTLQIIRQLILLLKKIKQRCCTVGQMSLKSR